ncbi:MAG TPA: DMT family transporter [Anaeromyxobacteraceae bacterium]|nr:DMT family transporter [Anaeromyxobacteraceae bacterium]
MPEREPHPPRRIPLPPALLLALAALFWAGNFVLGRAVSGRVPPVALAFWRWVLALALLLPLSWRSLRAQAPALRRAWPVVAALGVLGVGSFSTLVYMGLRDTTATNAVLLNSACPALIVAISFVTGAGRATPGQLGGIAVSLAGVVTIVSRGSLSALRGVSFNPGDLWVLAAVLAWAVYTVLLRRRPVGLDALALLTVLVAVGVAWIAPFYAWEMARGPSMRLDLVTLGSVAYVGIFPSVLSYAFWNQAVGEMGPSRAGVFIHLLPAFGSLLAILLLGESFRLFHAAGIALVLLGVTLAGRAPRPVRRRFHRAEGPR